MKVYSWIWLNSNCSYNECKVYQESWSQVGVFSTPPFLPNFGFYGDQKCNMSHKLWPEELPWWLCVCLCLSQSCAFALSATVWLLYWHPANTPQSCSGLLYPSSRGRSTGQTTQENVGLILLICFARVHSILIFFFITDLKDQCLCVYACVFVCCVHVSLNDVGTKMLLHIVTCFYIDLLQR